MKFSSKEDIEAPIETVFAVVSDFDSFERSAIRRGADVRCNGNSAAPCAGLNWDATFDMRGKQRQVNLVLSRFDPPTDMDFSADGAGVAGTLRVGLMALSPRRTRLSVELELKPASLPGRLFIQSLKLAKKNLTRRFKLKIADFARNVEDNASRLA